MKERLDKYTLAFIGLCFVMECFHVYQFIDSGFMINPLIRVVFYPIFIVTTVCIGKKSIPYVMSAFALVLALTMSFENFTPYILLIISCMIIRNKTYDIIMLSLYFIAVMVVCNLHDKSSIHIAIHIGGCVLIFMLGKLLNLSIKNLYTPSKLDLTYEEENLLHEIVINGKSLKELGNANTVSKKINACYKRNKLNNSKDLYEKYRIQYLSNNNPIISNKSND